MPDDNSILNRALWTIAGVGAGLAIELGILCWWLKQEIEAVGGQRLPMGKSAAITAAVFCTATPNQPIEGAHIVAESPLFGTFTGVTDASGLCTLNVLRDQEMSRDTMYKLTVTALGYADVKAYATIPKNASAVSVPVSAGPCPAPPQAQPGTVISQVYFTDPRIAVTKPLPGAKIEIHSAAGKLLASGSTDATGAVTRTVPGAELPGSLVITAYSNNIGTTVPKIISPPTPLSRGETVTVRFDFTSLPLA